MKKSLLLACLSVLLVSATAYAASLTLTGKWAGPAFANSSFDLDGDGIPGRTFQVNVYNQPRFAALEGAVDSHLVALPGGAGNNCPNPASEYEIEPLGQLIFRGIQDGALYASVNSSHHLCFNPAAPNEVLYYTITSGTGIYAGKTGTGTATLNDTTLMYAPGAIPVPLFVDTRGSFSLTIN